jgi:predicted permease
MSWITRLTHAFRPRPLEEDLDAEFRDHLRRRADDLQAAGASEADARVQATRAFGNAAVWRERSREVRLWSVLADSLQDLRYALRGAKRHPIFMATAVGSLSLAIGASTAVYSIVDAAILRPLPVAQPDQLVTLDTSGHEAANALPDAGGTFSYPLYQEFSQHAGIARLALVESPGRIEAQSPDAQAPYEQVIQQVVSANTFDVLDVAPALGRVFTDETDGMPGSPPVVVLSHAYWSRRFGSDPSVIGRPVLIAGRPYSILGVAREGFFGVEPGKFVDVWLTVTSSDPGILTNAEYQPFHILGRLAPGATREQLAVRLQPIFGRHQERRIALSPSKPFGVQQEMRQAKILARSGATGTSVFRDTFARSLWVLLAISGCILLIACANVASLLLARSAARAGEMALRVSLGAGRGRLMRQLCTESLFIAVLAGFFGWMLARAAAPALVAAVSSHADPIQLDLALETRALAFSAGLCAISAAFFGWLPAWHATSTPASLGLRQARTSSGRLRLSRLIVGLQVAFAFCLVTGGTAFVFSIRHLAAVPTGFDPHGVTVLTISSGASQWDRQLALMKETQARVAAQPGVQGAATAWMAMFSGSRRAQRVALPGHPLSTQEETFYRVSPGYFATLRTPLLRGRDLTSADNDDEPVASVVNRAFAARYFGTDAVVGRQFVRDDGVRHEIVGLAADSHYGDLRHGPEAVVYMPMKPPRAFTLYVRATTPANVTAAIVERETKQLGPAVRVSQITTLDALVGETMVREQLLAGVGGALAVLGLVLAAIGLFGLLNYSVARRTKELGIRAALGARRTTLYALVLKEIVVLVAGGLAAGLISAIALIYVARSLLFGVDSVDTAVIGTALAVFLGTAFVAGTLPAARAAVIDPLVALKDE